MKDEKNDAIEYETMCQKRVRIVGRRKREWNHNVDRADDNSLSTRFWPMGKTESWFIAEETDRTFRIDL